MSTHGELCGVMIEAQPRIPPRARAGHPSSGTALFGRYSGRDRGMVPRGSFAPPASNRLVALPFFVPRRTASWTTRKLGVVYYPAGSHSTGGGGAAMRDLQGLILSRRPVPRPSADQLTLAPSS